MKAAACPPLVTSYPGDPESLLVASSSERGKWYRVRDVWGGFPTCGCQGFGFRNDCKHVLAALEAAKEGLERMTTETTTAVAIRPPTNLENRLAATRASLLTTAGGINEAISVALQQQAMWPDELTKKLENAANSTVPAMKEKLQREAEAAAGIIVWKATSLGIDPLDAFSYITVIKGKPMIMARMVSAIVRRKAGCRIVITEQTATSVTGVAYRPGEQSQKLTITIGDAEKAGWTTNALYKTNPRAMLVARVTTTLGWQLFPDLLLGMGVYDADTDQAMTTNDLERTPTPIVVEGAPVVAEAAAPEEPAVAEYREVTSEAAPPAAPPSPPVSPRPQQPAVSTIQAKAIDAALDLAKRDPWKGLCNLCTAYRMQAVALLGRLVVPKAELTFEKVHAMAIALEYGAALDEAEQWNGIIERYAAATGDAPAAPYQEPASDDENNPFD